MPVLNIRSTAEQSKSEPYKRSKKQPSAMYKLRYTTNIVFFWLTDLVNIALFPSYCITYESTFVTGTGQYASIY